MVTFGKTVGDPNAADPIDRVIRRPDFLIMIYPVPLGIPDGADAPPAFLLAANDDVGHSEVIINQKYRAANVPVEVYIHAKGGHGFNIGIRSKLLTIKGWPRTLSDWLADSYILDPSSRPPGTPNK
jgi:acetyl esterase/lipase